MNKGLTELAVGVGDVLETVPELYEDAAQSSVQETGKLIARIPRAINAAFAGLDKWILNREYSIEETKKILALKLENVTPEKIVAPEPYVAIPTIQAISYTMNSIELRELYATLLAKSMNTDTKDLVHPGFIETIKQMSPDDARYFKHICPLEYRPMLSALVELPGSLSYTAASQINLFSKGYTNNMALSIDNLCRLGLIDIPNDIWYGEDAVYAKLLETVPPLYPLENYKERFPDALKMSYPKSRIDITPYGRLFYTICIDSISQSSPV